MEEKIKEETISELKKLEERKEEGKEKKIVNYGTAGFRMLAHLLEPTIFRMAALSVARSGVQKGKAIGLMITASHNPEQDNGVKLVDPSGDMLHFHWEKYASSLANCSPDLFPDVLFEVYEREKREGEGGEEREGGEGGEGDERKEEKKKEEKDKGVVVVGYDTRKSSPHLFSIVEKGVSLASQLLGITLSFLPLGFVATPQLHWIVASLNSSFPPPSFPPLSSPSSPSSPSPSLQFGAEMIESYYETFSSSFVQIVQLIKKMEKEKPATEVKKEKIMIDCACGVGGITASGLLPRCEIGFEDKVKIVNGVGEGVLNDGVGADFVKTKRTFPRNFEDIEIGTRCMALDGDADRLIYFYRNSQGEFRMLDGDKILTLFAVLLESLLKTAKLEKQFRIGVVQTAYANGASSNYVKEKLGLAVVMTNTGVKHLVKAAKEYDVGIYFEANGHGTMHFSPHFSKVVCESVSQPSDDPNQQIAKEILSRLPKVLNQTVGDALSDALLVEIALIYFGWTSEDWDSLYTDSPSRLCSLKVPERSVFVTFPELESRLKKPEGMQEKMDKIIEKFEKGRSFVRPSGTEDVVRVYAESSSEEDVCQLTKQICELVESFAEKKS